MLKWQRMEIEQCRSGAPPSLASSETEVINWLPSAKQEGEPLFILPQGSFRDVKVHGALSRLVGRVRLSIQTS